MRKYDSNRTGRYYEAQRAGYALVGIALMGAGVAGFLVEPSADHNHTIHQLGSLAFVAAGGMFVDRDLMTRLLKLIIKALPWTNDEKEARRDDRREDARQDPREEEE